MRTLSLRFVTFLLIAIKHRKLPISAYDVTGSYLFSFGLEASNSQHTPVHRLGGEKKPKY